MKRASFLAAGLVLASASILPARQDKTFVSATFHDIRERRLTQKRAEEILVLSGGRLQAGMTFAQVEARAGKPLAKPPIQAAGTVVWVFADKTLTFRNDRLAEMRLEKKE